MSLTTQHVCMYVAHTVQHHRINSLANTRTHTHTGKGSLCLSTGAPGLCFSEKLGGKSSYFDRCSIFRILPNSCDESRNKSGSLFGRYLSILVAAGGIVMHIKKECPPMLCASRNDWICCCSRAAIARFTPVLLSTYTAPAPSLPFASQRNCIHTYHSTQQREARDFRTNRCRRCSTPPQKRPNRRPASCRLSAACPPSVHPPPPGSWLLASRGQENKIL